MKEAGLYLLLLLLLHLLPVSPQLPPGPQLLSSSRCPGPLLLAAKGPREDGWQRIEHEREQKRQSAAPAGGCS